jgi:hypothetical protein
MCQNTPLFFKQDRPADGPVELYADMVPVFVNERSGKGDGAAHGKADAA